MPVINFPYNLDIRWYQSPLWKAYVVDGVKRGMVIWPRRNGKDLVTLNIATAKSQQRVGLYLYVAPFYAQIRNIIWEGADDKGRRFLDYIPKEVIKRKYESRMAIEFKNGSILRFGGADSPDSLVGGNPVGIIFTEFSLHKPEAWNYLRPILTNNGGWALFNGTPRGINHFFTMAEMAKKNPEWFYQLLTCEDTGFPSQEAIEEERQAGMPESLIRQEYYCDFMASSEMTLIPLDFIQKCMNTVLVPADYEFEPRILGADPAFSAMGDKAVISKRQGRLLHPLRKFQGMDNMRFANEIAREIKEWHPHAVMIDAGRGEGVISRLCQLGFEDIVFPVNFQGTMGVDNLYLNKRAEIWCKLRDWIVGGVNKGAPPLLPNDQNLITGMSTPMMEVNDKGKVQIESKKQIRGRGAYVMDEPDAVAVTFSEQIQGDKASEGHYERLRDELDRLENEEYDAESGYDPLRFFNGGDD